MPTQSLRRKKSVQQRGRGGSSSRGGGDHHSRRDDDDDYDEGNNRSSGDDGGGGSLDTDNSNDDNTKKFRTRTRTTSNSTSTRTRTRTRNNNNKKTYYQRHHRYKSEDEVEQGFDNNDDDDYSYDSYDDDYDDDDYYDHDDRKMDRRRRRRGGSSSDNNNGKSFCSTYYSQCIVIGLLVNVAVFACITSPATMKSTASSLSMEFLPPVYSSLVTSITQSSAGANTGAGASAIASDSVGYMGATTKATVYTRQDGSVRQPYTARPPPATTATNSTRSKTAAGTSGGGGDGSAGYDDTLSLFRKLASVPPLFCTLEQKMELNRQIPGGTRCKNTAKCRFRIITGGCQDPILARNFFANEYDYYYGGTTTSPTKEEGGVAAATPFVGIVIGWDNDEVPIDMLHIGSGLDPKYDLVSLWDSMTDKENVCRTQVIPSAGYINSAAAAASSMDAMGTVKKAFTDFFHDPNEDDDKNTKKNKEKKKKKRYPNKLPPTPEVYMIDWRKADMFVTKFKSSSLVPDDVVLSLDKIPLLGKYDANLTTDVFTDMFRKQHGGKYTKDQPIHYLNLGECNGFEYIILKSLLPSLLPHVRYLKFNYNHQGSWYKKGLMSTLNRLKYDAGMYCYWSGNGGEDGSKLWRITDCFLDHFEYNNFARIVCVSTIHDDAKELALQMETRFLKTLSEFTIAPW